MKKSLFSNFIYNAIYTGLNVLFPLITIPYVSRVLLADGLGRVNKATNILSWFILFASLGIPRYGVREIAKYKDSKENLSNTFFEIFFLNLISATIMSFVYYYIVIGTRLFADDQILYVIIGIQLILNVFSVDWFYQGIEEYRYITNRSIVVKTIALISMFVFVKNRSDYIIYALIQSLAVVGNNIFNVLKLRKYVQLPKKKLDLNRHIKPIFVLLSATLAVSIYTLLDTTMLGWFCSNSVVAYYTNCQKVIHVLASLCATLGGVLLPRFVEMKSKDRYNDLKKLAQNILEIIIFVCLPVTGAVFMLSNEIVLIMFGKDFLPAVITMKLFVPFVLVTTIGNLYGVQLLMTFDDEKDLLKCVVFGAIINFSLNYLLIPSLEQNGAVIASVVTEIVVMIAQILLCRKYVVLSLDFPLLLKTIFQTAIMIAGIFLLKEFVYNDAIFICTSAAIGFLLFIGSGIIFHNRIQKQLFEMCQHKIMHLRRSQV